MTEVELIRRLTKLLCSRMTSAGHLAQVVLTTEHRGNCLPPSKGCTDWCIEAGDLLLAADAYLAEHEAPVDRQVSLFEEVAG